MFKPFKPPLIRKQPQVAPTQQQSTHSDHEPLAKRRRISDESVVPTEGSRSDDIAATRAITANVPVARKPLTLVNNPSTVPRKSDQDAQEGRTNDAEAYYNVLW